MTTSKEFIQSCSLSPTTLICCETTSNVYTHKSYKPINEYSKDCLRIRFSNDHLFESEKLYLSKLKTLEDINFANKGANAFDFVTEITFPYVNSFETQFIFDSNSCLKQKRVVYHDTKYSQLLSCIDGPAYISYHENGQIEYETYFYNGINLTLDQNIKTVEQLQNYLLLT